MKSLFYYLLILINLFNFNLIKCGEDEPLKTSDKWVNPLDMYDIFDYAVEKESPFESVNKDVIIKESNPFVKTLGTSAVCQKNNQISMDCFQLLVKLVSSIYSHIPLKYDYDHYEVKMPFLLSKSDMDFIRLQSSDHISMNPALCQLILESLSRGKERTLMNRVMDTIGYVGSVFIDFLMNIKFQFRQLFRIEMQDFIVFQIFLIFLSSVLIFFTFKSIKFVIYWALMCFIFLSVYTMYSQRYQEAVAKRESDIVSMGHKLPPECNFSSRTYFHSFFEYFTGNNHCVEFFKRVHVSTAIEIHLSDILIDMFSSFWAKWLSSFFYEAHSVSEKLTAGYPVIFKQIMQIVLLFLCLLFFLLVLSFCLGSHISMFGFHWQTRGVADAIPKASHREFVEHVPTAVPAQKIDNEPNHKNLPSAEWFHDFLELQKKNVEYKILQDVNNLSNQPSTSYSSRVKNIGIQRLKSFGNMVARSPKEINGDTSKRRGSI